MNEQQLEKVILANTDQYLPELYNFVKDLGLTVIINDTNGYVIDSNCEKIIGLEIFVQLILFIKGRHKDIQHIKWMREP